jgi:hypothetical protein
MPAATGHYVFTEPSNPDIRIWRYMDFAKYVSLLETSALWFSRADKLGESFEGKLGDPFEGAISRATLEHRLRLFEATSDRIEELVQDRRNRSNSYGTYREWAYINSWHMNEARVSRHVEAIRKEQRSGCYSHPLLPACATPCHPRCVQARSLP